MNYNIPSHISPATILRAARLAKNAKSIGFFAGNVYWDDTGDNVYFMFTNKHDDLILVHCCPHVYFVERFDNDKKKIVDTDFSMVTNVRHLMYWIRKNGFYDCEHLKKKKDE
jgi:hypothetical protein